MNETELDLRYIIDSVLYYFKAILSQWYIVLIIAILFSCFTFYTAYNKQNTYEASFKYSMGGGSNFGALLGGFGLPGLGGGGESQLSKSIEILKSRKFNNQILLTPITINDTTDFVANFIIQSYKLHKEWDELDDLVLKEKLKNFKFKHSDIDKFNKTELKVLKIMYSYIYKDSNKDCLLNINTDAITGISTVTIISINENLSYQLSNLILNNIQNYFLEKSKSKAYLNKSVLKEKTDSIKNAIDYYQKKLAKFNDSHNKLVFQENQIEPVKIMKEIEKLSLMYSEITKNLEISDVSMKTISSDIEVLDEAFLPLKANTSSPMISAIKGLIIGIVLASIFIILHRILKDIYTIEKQ